MFIGTTFIFGCLNVLLDKPLLNAASHFFFSALFGGLYWLHKRDLELTLSLAAIVFQAFIFVFGFYLLPGKQIEAGLGILTAILPIFLGGYRMWAVFLGNLVLYHIILFGVGYDQVFQFQYIFYLVLFVMVRTIVRENQRYEQLLTRQRDTIQQNADALRQADELKTRFFANISHELRTPLTLILTPIETLLESQQLSTQHHNTLRLMQHHGRKLLKRIQELLELSRLDAGKLEIQFNAVRLDDFVQRAVATYQEAAHTRGLTLNYHTDLPTDTALQLDAARLDIILSNFLSNAIKFTPQGGRVAVRSSRRGQDLVLSVTDSGIGIPDAERKRVFERFYQVDTGDYYEGTGIGLAMCRELATLLGGRVWVESEPGVGSTFFVGLPYRVATEPVPRQPGITVDSVSVELQDDPTPSPNRPTLLIVEDNPDILQYLVACTADLYDVTTATDGLSGIELAIEKVPDLVITDVMMPRKDGFELVDTLKRDERTSHIPIVVITARADDASRLAGLERGADAYLAKPFNKRELLIRLQKLLELRRLLQQRYADWQPTTEPSQQPGEEIEDAFLRRVHEAVLAQLDNEDLTVQDLCRTLGVSRTQLHKKLKALTGRSTTRYVRHIRLQQARQLLLQTDRTVSEISMAVGFKYVENLSRYYKEEFGEPPSASR